MTLGEGSHGVHASTVGWTILGTMPKYRLVTVSGTWEFEASPGDDSEKRASFLLSKSGEPEGQLERRAVGADGLPDWEQVKNVYRMRRADEGSD